MRLIIQWSVVVILLGFWACVGWFSGVWAPPEIVFLVSIILLFWGIVCMKSSDIVMGGIIIILFLFQILGSFYSSDLTFSEIVSTISSIDIVGGIKYLFTGGKD